MADIKPDLPELIAAAERHGEAGGPDLGRNDLLTLFELCNIALGIQFDPLAMAVHVLWQGMDEDQRDSVLGSEYVKSLLKDWGGDL